MSGSGYFLCIRFLLEINGNLSKKNEKVGNYEWFTDKEKAKEKRAEMGREVCDDNNGGISRKPRRRSVQQGNEVTRTNEVTISDLAAGSRS